jgi:predicted butyrate kinase (DUF1464 family)
MVRVVGSDPGTSSLDLILLVDGQVSEQARLEPTTLRANPHALADVIRQWEPIDLVAGPSGYGVPLVRGHDLTERDLDLMSLVRPSEKGTGVGIVGLRQWIRTLIAANLPVIFMPGAIHLPTIPEHRKVNRIDMGTPDKVAVAALALRIDADRRGGAVAESTFAVVEIGSAFTSILVVVNGQIVAAASGTNGPIGMRSGGAWDGEVAYWLSPLSKSDLFRGGVEDVGELGLPAFRESLVYHVAALLAITPFARIYLSGRVLERPAVLAAAREALSAHGEVQLLPSLPRAWVKHSAQGAALLADGLAGGHNSDLIDSLALRRASGTILDSIHVRTEPLRELG